MISMLSSVNDDLMWLYEESTRRRLADAAKWSGEMLYGLSVYAEQEGISLSETVKTSSTTKIQSHALRLAVSLLDCTEFERAAHLLTSTAKDDSYSTFMLYYAKYLAGEKLALSSSTDVGNAPDTAHIDELRQTIMPLVADLTTADPFVVYLYAQLLIDTDVDGDEARRCLQHVVNKMPAFWPAWALLVRLVNDPYTLTCLDVPTTHWLYTLFVAECRLQLHEGAVDLIMPMHEGIFRHCPYVTARLAHAFKANKQNEDSLACYSLIFAADPYRLDDHDAYSCELFIQSKSHADDESAEHRLQLCQLAHTCHRVDPFARETCVVLGNYHGKRNEHQQAVVQFERALRLNPRASDGVWTLIGHEFMEMKNSSAACLAYRKALEVDSGDYRAWYGLGQMYDILRMPSHALHYYSMAHKSRPTDSRMLVALADMYHKVGRLAAAQKCYWRAHSVGDVECQAILRLARLYEKEGERDEAAKCYTKYLAGCEGNVDEDVNVKLQAYRYLCDWCLTKGDVHNAAIYVHELSDEPSMREESRSLLRRLQNAQTAAVKIEQS